MTKKRTKRPHKAKRTRVFFHNARQAWPKVGIFAGPGSQDGWLREYRAKRAAWAADARERARQRGQEEADVDALIAIGKRREARERERVGR